MSSPSSAMCEDLITLSATEAVHLLKKKEISPLELIDAAEQRIHAVDPALNALPTRCFDRARAHATRLLAPSQTAQTDTPGWLAGLPVAIKDLTEVAGVRTTYGSPLYENHIPETSHALVSRIEAKGGIIIAKSNTPEFGSGGATFNEVFGRTHNPWNTALTPGGSTGGGAAALAAGEIWLAHGTDHAGSLRRPATYCAVVGLRPSAGRVTRGAPKSLFAPDSVHGPMGRTVADVALFLDTMAGLCPHDPLTFDAPTLSFSDSLKSATAPKRVAFTADYDGSLPLARETRALCEAAAQKFAELGATVETVTLSLKDVKDAFLTLRAHHYVVHHAERLAAHPTKLKSDIIWNTETGLTQTPEKLARAEHIRAAFYRRAMEIFTHTDILITPGAASPAFDVNLRMPDAIDGVKLETYIDASLITGAISLLGLPAISVPCGFDRHNRPVGLQLIGPPRGEAKLLQAAHLLMAHTQWDRQTPISPRSGVVPD